MLITSRSFTRFAALLLLAACAEAQAPHPHNFANEPSFEQQMATAMIRMDRDMSKDHTGDPDRDFANMMIPHHQGAIDMARAELQFGHDPVLLRLAQGIIVEQQQEIEILRRELHPLSPHRQPQAR